MRQCAALELQLSSNFLSHTVEISSIFHRTVTEYPTIDFEPYLTIPEQTEVVLAN